MSRLALLIACLVAVVAHGADLAPVHYTLRFPDAAAHYVDIEAEFPTDGQSELIVFMPVWTPGSYMVREYSRNIVKFDATTLSGEALTSEKVTKNRWKITAAGQSRVRVNYRLYGREINVRGNWIEQDHAMLNGAPTFVTVVNNFQRPYRVRVELPERWKGSYTPLTPAGEANTYTAPDFDTLVDSPIIVGNPLTTDFEVGGVKHVLVTVGGDEVWDNARAAEAFKTMAEAQRTFWGKLPFTEPYYVFNLLTGTRGGLEHRQSLVMSADRWLSRNQGGITSWLSLASHEYFHVWNGKRLRPVEYGPFDYETENYSKSLWVVEGLTSYYQHVMLARAGFYTQDQYLGAVSGSIAGAERTPGRLMQAMSDSSFDAWIKSYRPDENSVNVLFSYYGGGSIVGLLLDAEIQRLSGGQHSLDEVMRLAFSRYSDVKGYSQEEFIGLVKEVSGQDLSAWFKRVVQTPGRFDYQPMLDWYGLEFEKPAAPKKTDEKSPERKDPPTGWLGIDTANRDGRAIITAVRSDTPASAAGLSVDDEILAVNGYRVRQDELPRRLSLYSAGTKVELLVTRQDRVITVAATLAEEPKDTWKLKVRADATAEQKARLEKLLATPKAPAEAAAKR